VVAYDYTDQRWVEGDEARQLLQKQLNQTLDLIESDRGADYLAFIGSAMTQAQAAARIRDKLRQLAASDKQPEVPKPPDAGCA
jgi:hypothetical protein